MIEIGGPARSKMLSDPEIGGAIVRRFFETFNRDGTKRQFRSGDQMSGDEVRAIGNRKALAEGGWLDIFPASDLEEPEGKLWMISRGHGLYDVIKGVAMTPQPVPRDEAEALIKQWDQEQ